GFLVVCADDPGALTVGMRARAAGVQVRTYGECAEADVRVASIDLAGIGVSFDVVEHGRNAGRLHLRVPGRHNALNAAAALTAGMGLGYTSRQLCEGLAGFTGTRRRFEFKGYAAGVWVYDDYAHHPTEVAAVLTAARPLAGDGRVVAIFQPHLFSRTRVFAAEFGKALGAADEVIVMDVYPAREDPEPGVTGALVAAAVPLPQHLVTYVPSWSAVPEVAAARLRPGDVVFTFGAGDVTLIGPEILELLDRQVRPDGSAAQPLPGAVRSGA
ncbi:MAG: UDP-N-acetylmuramate--L-alanine ligase, partial [Jiangellaceae bacterium]|nr:UDP-N-acetylmuramate--L-alanine ligase [Jiangellaceae bacterium]